MSVDVRIRPFTQADTAFCRDSFYKGGASASEYQGIDPNILKPGLRARFDRIKQLSQIVIACDFEHDEPLFGWAAVTNLESHSIVWWVYVKSGYRGFGFARKMIEDSCYHEEIYYPFRSRVSAPFALSFDARFHPFLLEEFLSNEDKKALHL